MPQKIHLNKLLWIVLATLVLSNSMLPLAGDSGRKEDVPLNAFGVRTAHPFVVERFIHDGKTIDRIIVPGPPEPPPEIELTALQVLPLVDKASGINVLSDVPASSWAFGCSATAAAMMFGYYDHKGYADMYTGPTNGGLFPMTNQTWGTALINGETRALNPLSATRQDLDGRLTRGHVDDYWIKYNNNETDPWISNGWTEHEAGDCTGDFMGTNQSRFGNSDGATTFYFWMNGDPLYDYSASEPTSRDGCHGMKLFVESRGYQVQYLGNFNQLIQGYNGNTKGFTFADFRAEIDAGRPVLIQVEGHTMLGFGYNESGSLVYLHNTWDHSTHSMTWGQSYGGMAHYGVTVLRLAAMQIPESPTMISPENNAGVGGTSILFQWQEVPGADRYRIQVRRVSDNSVFLNHYIGNVTSFNMSGFPNDGTQFRWRMQAGNDAGWSPFTTYRILTNASVQQAPDPPQQVSPENNANVGGTSILFQWQEASGADQYRIQVRRVSDNSVFLNHYIGNVTSYNMSGFPNDGTQFRWRMQAGNDTGWSPFTTYRVLTNAAVQLTPDPPQQVSPENNANVGGTSILFQWQEASGADQYRIQVRRVSDNSVFLNHYIGNVTSYNMSGFPDDGTQFRWRMQAGNEAGWSAFTVYRRLENRDLPEPDQPELVYPADNAILGGKTLFFQWEASARAADYHLEVRRLSNDAPFLDAFVGNVTSFSWSGFPNDGTQFKWRVRAGNDEGWSDWSPVRIFSSRHLGQIAAGYNHSVALDGGGAVVAAGSDADGRSSVQSWTDVVQFAAGHAHTLGLQSDGTVLATGGNDQGQIDVASWTGIVQVSTFAAAAEEYSHSLGLKSDGLVLAAGRNTEGQGDVGSWSGVKQVAAGSVHSLGLLGNGTVLAVGADDQGQCATGDWTGMVQVAAGGVHSVGLKSDGTVLAVGGNDYGQCDVSSWSGVVQVAAGAFHTLALKSDGTVLAVGDNGQGQLNVSSWAGIVQVAAGHAHSLGLKKDGTVLAAGWNEHGQCNVGGWNLYAGQAGFFLNDTVTARDAGRADRGGRVNEWPPENGAGLTVPAESGNAFLGGGEWLREHDSLEGWYLGDFDGDGKTDLLRYLPGEGSQVFLSDGGRFVAAGAWTTAENGSDGWYVGDFDGDGRSDLMRYLPGIGGQVFLSSGTSFTYTGTWTEADLGAEGWYIGDFDGDGRDDLMRYEPGYGSQVFLSDGGRFVAAGIWTEADSGLDGWYLGDFNGDGRTDLLSYRPGLGSRVYLSDGSAFLYAGTWSGSGAGVDGWYIGDFNGSSHSDLLRYAMLLSGAEVLLNSGAGFVYDGGWSFAGRADDDWYPGDFNGDGRTDLLRFERGSGRVEVLLSAGTQPGFRQLTRTRPGMEVESTEAWLGDAPDLVLSLEEESYMAEIRLRREAGEAVTVQQARREYEELSGRRLRRTRILKMLKMQDGNSR